jgi:predicted dithiol-disulfide oxidoreductase (DUF899 family)
MNPKRVVSHQEWVQERKAFLAKEKEFSKQRDALAAARRALPWEKVEANYVFEGPGNKKESLADLFAGKDQLLVYHFMLGPGWKAGCPSCSYIADNFQGAIVHLEARGVAFAAMSRAPIAEIETFKKRMGWTHKWLSSFGTRFNYDFQVSGDEGAKPLVYNYEPTDDAPDERPGISAFAKDDAGNVFHTYSSYARGLDILIGTYNYLDITPKGRNEDAFEWPMQWVRHHDNYR